jgi:hypothetical protein
LHLHQSYVFSGKAGRGWIVTALFRDLTAQGLVLWRLRRSTNQQLWCTVFERDGELALTFHDPSSNRRPVAETHPHIGPLVDRADELRVLLVGAGWTEVDVALGEPESDH